MSMPEPIVVVDYDPAWPEAFARERNAIVAALGEAMRRVIGIEHVGSTSVPGLAAKPIIDISIGVRAIADGVPCITPLVGLGYQCVGEFGIPDHIYFRKRAPRSHHVHLAPYDGAFWREHMAFRDILRARPDLVDEYARLKRQLAVRHDADLIGYTEAKTPFIRSVLAQVLPKP